MSIVTKPVHLHIESHVLFLLCHCGPQRFTVLRRTEVQAKGMDGEGKGRTWRFLIGNRLRQIRHWIRKRRIGPKRRKGHRRSVNYGKTNKLSSMPWRAKQRCDGRDQRSWHFGDRWSTAIPSLFRLKSIPPHVHSLYFPLVDYRLPERSAGSDLSFSTDWGESERTNVSPILVIGRCRGRLPLSSVLPSTDQLTGWLLTRLALPRRSDSHQSRQRTPRLNINTLVYLLSSMVYVCKCFCALKCISELGVCLCVYIC